MKYTYTIKRIIIRENFTVKNIRITNILQCHIIPTHPFV